MVIREKGYSLVKVMKVVESDCRLREIDVKVYHWIGTYSKSFWISYLDIYGRKGLNISFRELIESLERLREYGYLEQTKKGSGKYGDLFIFRLFNVSKDDTLYGEVNPTKQEIDIDSMILKDEVLPF